MILSDQRMPGMTRRRGLAAGMAIRPETTRLLFTAYADIRTVIDAINQGNVFRYLAKPCDPEVLAVVVRQAVEHHDLIVEKNRLLAELRESNARLAGGQPAQGGVHRGRQPRAQHAGHGRAGDDRALEDVAGPDAPRRQSASGSTGSAPRPAGWPGPSSACSSWSGIATSASRSTRSRSSCEPLIERAIEELAPYLELRRQTVTVDVEPDLGSIEADPTKIADVLINLLANAVKFTPDGGTIRVEARAEPTAPDWIRVEVSDQGVGVAPGDQQHLFEPFFTGFDTLRHSSGEYQFGKRGIGLGLAWSRPSWSCTAAAWRLQHARRRLDLRLRPATISSRAPPPPRCWLRWTLQLACESSRIENGPGEDSLASCSSSLTTAASDRSRRGRSLDPGPHRLGMNPPFGSRCNRGGSGGRWAGRLRPTPARSLP